MLTRVIRRQLKRCSVCLNRLFVQSQVGVRECQLKKYLRLVRKSQVNLIQKSHGFFSSSSFNATRAARLSGPGRALVRFAASPFPAAEPFRFRLGLQFAEMRQLLARRATVWKRRSRAVDVCQTVSNSNPVKGGALLIGGP